MNNNTTNNYYASLNGLRAIAVLLVMSFHFRLNDFGWVGVLLFFVLSGFLITERLQFAQANDWSLGKKLKWFWLHRALRIFPLYFLFLLILTVCFSFFQQPSLFNVRAPFLYTFTFNIQRLFTYYPQNIVYGPLWSICVEEQFYLIYPIVFFLIPKKWLNRFPFIFIAASIIARMLLHHEYKSLSDHLDKVERIYYHPFSHIDSFMLGAILAIHKERLSRYFTKLKIHVWSSLLFVGMGMQMCFYWKEKIFLWKTYIATIGYSIYCDFRLYHIWAYTVVGFFFASIIGICLLADLHQQKNWILQILRSQFLQYIGKISFGMYLFHGGIHWLFLQAIQKEPNDLPTLFFIPYTAAVVVVSAISYHLFEQKFLRLKKKIIIT